MAVDADAGGSESRLGCRDRKTGGSGGCHAFYPQPLFRHWGALNSDYARTISLDLTVNYGVPFRETM
jgi:hypothetical protein